MPFDELETFTKANAPPVATISYTPRVSGLTLVISVPTTVCGVSKSKTFRLLLGSGADKGKLLIRGDLAANKPKAGATQAGVEPTQHKNYFRFHFGKVPRLGSEKFEGEKRPVRKVSDEEFEITVPESWFEQEEK